MKYIKKYKEYLESIQIDVALINIDINESLGMFYENILKSIGAEEIVPGKIDLSPQAMAIRDMLDTQDKMNLDSVTSNPKFIEFLNSKELKSSSLQNTEDYETFVNKPCRFVLIYKIEANELENPEYIIFQSKNETLDRWDDIKIYKLTGEFKNFYDKLSSKVIEIEKDGNVYIYQSPNKNEWILQNLDKKNDDFKEYFRKDEFEKFINDNKFAINIK